MKARSLIASFVAMLGLSTSAWALDWSAADALYAQRQDNRAVIAQARAAYLTLLGQATETADKLRAVSQLGRLAVYEGEMILPKDASAERRAIFQECWCADPRVSLLGVGSCAREGFVDAIHPDRIGQNHPAYHYFHGVCLAYWGEQGSLPEKLAFTSWISRDIRNGQAVDQRYEGGGINRLAAGLWSNPATRPLGIYNPQDALRAIDQALTAQAYPGDPSSGSSYYDNWQGKATVLLQLHADDPSGGHLQAVTDLTTSKLAEMDEKIEDDDLPARRGAEFHFNYKKLKEHYHQATGQDWP